MIYDYAIIGAGMAGASIAAELARLSRGKLKIALLEAEDAPGYHATGRSAAFWEECYGGPDIVPLTLASGAYLQEHGFLKPRGALYIGRAEDVAALDAFERRFGQTGATFERIGQDALPTKVATLKPEWSEAIWQPDCADIDVAGLHQHYLTMAKKYGVDLVTRFRLASAKRIECGWHLSDERGRAIETGRFVNAAGAWADEVARIAGFEPKGISPLRRTVVQLRVDPKPFRDQPLVLDISGRFYFKPEGERLWLSPHDEVPSSACDAAPEELDIATAIDRLEQVLDVKIKAVERSWAGLRSFAPDRLPVYGPDPADERFVWFAGQGGYGIQTAPAAARLLAETLLGLPRSGMTETIDPVPYSAARFG